MAAGFGNPAGAVYGPGAGRKGRGWENEGAREAVERVGRLGDMTLIEAAGRKVGSVVCGLGEFHNIHTFHNKSGFLGEMRRGREPLL